MKSDKLVVNASPVISLANIGQIDLLSKLSSELIIPDGVCHEILSHSREDAAVSWIKSQDSYSATSVKVPLTIQAWNLGTGESEVIAFAHENRKFTVVIDDRPARRCAGLFNLTILGTISLIVRAKKEGYIDRARPVLSDLQSTGFRIKQDIIQEAIMLSGED